MQTTRISSKGQVIIPKAIRDSHHWQTGLELLVIDTADGVLLKPQAPFPVSELADVAGLFKDQVKPKSAAEIEAAIAQGVRRHWRDRD